MSSLYVKENICSCLSQLEERVTGGLAVYRDGGVSSSINPIYAMNRVVQDIRIPDYRFLPKKSYQIPVRKPPPPTTR